MATNHLFFVGGERRVCSSSWMCRHIQNGTAEFASAHNCSSHLGQISREDHFESSRRQRLVNNALPRVTPKKTCTALQAVHVGSACCAWDRSRLHPVHPTNRLQQFAGTEVRSPIPSCTAEICRRGGGKSCLVLARSRSCRPRRPSHISQDFLLLGDAVQMLVINRSRPPRMAERHPDRDPPGRSAFTATAATDDIQGP